MKAGLISAAAVGLAGLAAAHSHHEHARLHKRELVVETVTDYVTDMVEDIVVYVDADGKPLSTSTFYKTMAKTEVSSAAPAAPTTTTVAAANFLAAAPASTPAASSAAAPAPASSAPASSSAAPSSAAPAPASSSAAASSSESSSSSSSSSGSSSSGSSNSGISPPKIGGIGWGSGISYSPYHDNHNCKTSSEIAQDIGNMNMDLIRLYGTDCNQVANTLTALKGKSTQLMVGIFDVGSANSEAQTIIDAVNANGGSWNQINTVNVGNEVVNNGGSVSQVTAAVSSVRSQLQKAGFKGPVVTVDTMVAHKAHPELCQASDFCAINCHAFFDGNVEASGAGPFVLGWVQQIAAMNPSKQVLVTESGWPSRGSTNGKAVPSEANQQAAVNSLKATFSNNMILYSAYNNMWMTSDAAQFNAEQYWGIHGMAPSS